MRTEGAALSLRRCSSSGGDVDDLHILLAHNQASMLKDVPLASLEMFSCLLRVSCLSLTAAFRSNDSLP